MVRHTYPDIRGFAHPTSTAVDLTKGLLPMPGTSGSDLDSPQQSDNPEGHDLAAESRQVEPKDRERAHASHSSPFARLGAWAATHFRRILVAWLLVLLVFGFFAVRVETSLAGAGWQASSSQSVQARAIIEKNFSGLGATALQVVVVDHHGPIASDPQAQAIVCLLYTSDAAD